jgi:hypothetical protein
MTSAVWMRLLYLIQQVLGLILLMAHSRQGTPQS